MTDPTIYSLNETFNWKWLAIGICLVMLAVSSYAAGRFTACAASGATAVGWRCYNITELGTCKMSGQTYVVPANLTYQYNRGWNNGTG